MMTRARTGAVALACAAAILMLAIPRAGGAAAPAQGPEADARAALQALYAKVPAAKALGAKAQGILVLPNM